MLENLLLVLVTMIGTGAPAVVPWRAGPVGGPDHDSGTRWLWTAWLLAALLPLVVIAGLALLNQLPDEAIDAGLLPLTHSLPGKLTLLMLPVVLATLVLLGVGGSRLGVTEWRLGGVLGVILAAAAAWFFERLRAAGGPPSQGIAWVLLVACRWLFVVSAGEVVAPGRPLWAPLAGVAVVPSIMLLPTPVRDALWPIASVTALAAALALLAARWLPLRLRRPAVLLGVLLLAVLWVEAARVSSGFAGSPVSPQSPQ